MAKSCAGGLRRQSPNRAIDARGPALAPDVPSMRFTDYSNGRVGAKCEVMEELIAQFRPTCLVMDTKAAALRLLPGAPLQDVSKVILERPAQFGGQDAITALDLHLRLRGFTRAGAFQQGRIYLYLRLNA
jgi:hypothetical protein